jgi:hypothetical protein
MAALEVIALDTATPQLRAPGASDTYTFPRAVSFSQPITYGGVTLNNAVTGAGSMVLSSKTIQNKTGAYTVVAGDAGSIINCTSGTFTLSLTSAATLGAGFVFNVLNTSTTTTDVITIDPAGSETIDNSATLALRRGDGLQIVSDGTNWLVQNKRYMRGYSENIGNNTARATASATGAIALGQQATASGTYASAIGFEVTAAASLSFAAGSNSSSGGAQTATGAGAMSLGGSYASGVDSFAAAVANNTSSYGAKGANSVAIGKIASASQTNSIAIGDGSQATGAGGYNIAIGYNAFATAAAAIAISTAYSYANTTASGQSSIAIGDGAQATAANAIAFGRGAVAGIAGKFAVSTFAFAAAGDSQTGTFILRRATADATPVVLTSNNSTGATNNQIVLPNNSAYAFTGTVVARQQAADGTASAAWKIEGLIRREANAASTVLVASTVTAIDNAPSWTLALSADTTNGGLAITATGAAATDIRWVATVQTSEVTYA